MTDRKKPGVALWATVALIVVLVGYPLSFGPACWLADRGMMAWKPVWSAYYPLAAIVARAPDSVSNALRDWGTFGSPKDGIPIAFELDAETWINAHRRR